MWSPVATWTTDINTNPSCIRTMGLDMASSNIFGPVVTVALGGCMGP